MSQGKEVDGAGVMAMWLFCGGIGALTGWGVDDSNRVAAIGFGIGMAVFFCYMVVHDLAEKYFDAKKESDRGTK